MTSQRYGDAEGAQHSDGTRATRASPTEDRVLGAFIGLAVGDAVGTTLEFRQRDTYAHLNDMIGGGPFNLRPGEWTDDTSMALCLMDSLLACADLDAADLMERFLRWWRNGENSVKGTCFDIGNTTALALLEFERRREPLAGNPNPYAGGNGSIMRLAPVVLRWWRDPSRAMDAARLQSRTTHAASACVEGCAFLTEVLLDPIRTGKKSEALKARRSSDRDIDGVSMGSWRDKRREEIRSSGYVVHTLEAALWSVGRCDTFREAVLCAANLGDDADTVAAVAGQIAGAIWGLSAIPDAWLDRLAWRDDLLKRARALYDKGQSSSSPCLDRTIAPDHWPGLS